MKIGGEPIRRWCEIAYLEPIHRCCTFVSMMKIGTWRTNPFTKWKLVVVEAIPGNEQITASIGGELPLSQRFFLKLFFGKEKASSQAATTSPEEARREREKPLSLLAASRLVVSEQWRLARSFAKKYFKKNLWAQSSGESIRRWFKNRRTGSPYRWTRS